MGSVRATLYLENTVDAGIAADGRKAEWQRAGPVTVRIGNRRGNFDCLVGPPASEALIGQIVLAQLDLIVDSKRQELAVRPESPLLPMLSVK